MQTFCNTVPRGESHEGSGMLDPESLISDCKNAITHCSSVSCENGYKAHAMLFVDGGFCKQRVQRETPLAALSFRPTVRFCSTDYKYVKVDTQYTIVLALPV